MENQYIFIYMLLLVILIINVVNAILSIDKLMPNCYNNYQKVQQKNVFIGDCRVSDKK